MPSWTNLCRVLLSYGSKLSGLVFEAPLDNRKLQSPGALVFPEPPPRVFHLPGEQGQVPEFEAP